MQLKHRSEIGDKDKNMKVWIATFCTDWEAEALIGEESWRSLATCGTTGIACTDINNLDAYIKAMQALAEDACKELYERELEEDEELPEDEKPEPLTWEEKDLTKVEPAYWSKQLMDQNQRLFYGRNSEVVQVMLTIRELDVFEG